MARNKAYQLAEEQIEEARWLRANKLSLDGWGNPEKLTELPESLGQFTQLQKLDLSGNNLTALPD